MSSKSQHPMYDFSVLRTLRKREDMTISDVSDKSGVSTAVISKLERNKTKADLDTLYKTARVFGMTATDLLAMAESPLAHIAKAESYRSSGFLFQKVQYSNVACYLGTATQGAHVKKPEIHHDEHEVCWVISGSIRLTLPHETHVLEAGESLQFDAIQEHTYEALEDLKVIIIHVRKAKRF